MYCIRITSNRTKSLPQYICRYNFTYIFHPLRIKISTKCWENIYKIILTNVLRPRFGSHIVVATVEVFYYCTQYSYRTEYRADYSQGTQYSVRTMAGTQYESLRYKYRSSIYRTYRYICTETRLPVVANYEYRRHNECTVLVPYLYVRVRMLIPVLVLYYRAD